jgi:hypothetical protein
MSLKVARPVVRRKTFFSERVFMECLASYCFDPVYN